MGISLLPPLFMADSFATSAGKLEVHREAFAWSVFPLKGNLTEDNAGTPEGCVSANICQFYS